MKKLFCFLLAAIMLFSLSSCSSRRIKIDYGESDLYTLEERETVANMIIEYFEAEDNELIDLKFAGDSICSSQLEMFNRQEDKEYEECLVYIAHYSTPEAIKYFNQPERTTGFSYVKEPGGEWYLKGIGW
jgi:hypothetical protein